jgi:hypothetical protein
MPFPRPAPHPHPLPTQGEGRLPASPTRIIGRLAPPLPRVGAGWGGGVSSPEDKAAR